MRGIKCITNRNKRLSDEVLLKYGLSNLPPIFKTFLRSFELEYNMFSTNQLLYRNEKHHFTYLEMYNDLEVGKECYTACIDHLLDLDKLSIEVENYKKKSDHWHDLGLLKIGLIGHADLLLLGIEDQNKDEIWRYGTQIFDTICSKLENNIYELFSRLSEKIDLEILEDLNLKPLQLYKNWGEDFWRVRKDN